MKRAFLHISYLIFITAGLISCSDKGGLAGNSSKVGSSQEISGVFNDADKNPIPDALVKLYTSDYISSLAKKAAAYKDSVITNKKGVFSFKNVHPGEYYVEAAASKSEAVRVQVTKKSNEGLELPPVSPQKTGGIRGTINLPPNSYGRSVVYIVGSDRLAPADSATGKFEFIHLAPGAYRLRCVGADPPRPGGDFLVDIQAGEFTENVSFDLGPSIPGSPGRLSGVVRLAGGAAVPALVRINELDLSVATGKDGLFTFTGIPEGSYNLQAWQDSQAGDTAVIKADIRAGVVTYAEIDLPLNVLIINGQGHHDWQLITSHLITIFNRTGFIHTGILTVPPKDSPPEAWESWKPDFSNYNTIVFVADHHDDITDDVPWPLITRQKFESYMSNGGGLVIHHASQRSFQGKWREFVKMAGLFLPKNLAQSTDKSLVINKDKIVVALARDEAQADYLTQFKDSTLIRVLTEHPITSGLPRAWWHAQDGIHSGLFGPAENITVLSYASFDETEAAHPVEWVVRYGEGRIYANMMGHGEKLNEEEQKMGRPENPDHRCIGFQTNLLRAIQWTATGTVDFPVPADYPNENKTSLSDDFN